MDMPKLGPAQEKLKIFVGEWRGKEKMSPSPWLPNGGEREAKISNKLALGGFAVAQDYAQLDKGKVVYPGHAVLMKNPAADNYQMYWFDMFWPSVFEGSVDGDKWVFTSVNPGGQHSRATYDFSSSGAYMFRMEMSEDGKSWKTMMEGSYSKA